MIDKDILKQIRQFELLALRLSKNLLAGTYQSIFKGTGIEFSDVREYVEGDDPRHIDWNVSSRSTDVFTKTFKEERELAFTIITDVSASMMTYGSNSLMMKTLQQVFAVFAFTAVMHHNPVGAIFFSDTIEEWLPQMRGKMHAYHLVQQLITLKPKGVGSNIEEACQFVHSMIKKHGLCIIISDFKSSGYWRNLSLLSKKQDVIAIRIVPHIDIAVPSIGTISVHDPELKKNMLLIGRSRKFRTQLSRYWTEKSELWREQCIKRNIMPLEIYTDEDPVQRLVQFFHNRKHVVRGQKI